MIHMGFDHSKLTKHGGFPAQGYTQHHWTMKLLQRFTVYPSSHRERPKCVKETTVLEKGPLSAAPWWLHRKKQEWWISWCNSDSIIHDFYIIWNKKSTCWIRVTINFSCQWHSSLPLQLSLCQFSSVNAAGLFWDKVINQHSVLRELVS